MISKPTGFLPPSGVRFRLFSRAANKVLARTTLGSGLFGEDQAEINEDQWFYLLRGSDKNEGKFGFRHCKSGLGVAIWDEKLIVLPSSEIGWFDIRDDDNLEPNSFEFVQDGRWAAAAFFTKPPIKPKLFDCFGTSWRPGESINYSNVNGITLPWPDKKDTSFSFLFEDVVPIKIDYDIDQGKVLSSTPMVLATETVHNSSNVQQKSSITLSATIENSSSWNDEAGITIGASVEFQAGIPMIASNKFTLSVEGSYKHSWGRTESKSEAWSHTLEVAADPGKTVRATASATKAVFDVPFTVTWHSKASKVTFTTEGTFRGVTTYNIFTTYSLVQTEQIQSELDKIAELLK